MIITKACSLSSKFPYRLSDSHTSPCKRHSFLSAIIKSISAGADVLKLPSKPAELSVALELKPPHSAMAWPTDVMTLRLSPGQVQRFRLSDPGGGGLATSGRP